MNVLIDGLIINYQDIGDKNKDCILFLHGWADDSSTFRGLAGSLSSEYRCISMDFPGFGKSGLPAETMDLPDFAAVAGKLMEKIKTKPYVLIGHSNGGAVAINAAAAKKINPKKLILLASSGRRSTQKVKKTIYRVMAKPAKAALIVLPKNKRQKVRQKLYSRIGSDYLVAENMKETFRNIVAYDIAEDAAELKVPTLLIYGSEDTSTPPEMGRWLHDLIKDSRLEVIDGAGHFVHNDAKPETTELIKDFLK